MKKLFLILILLTVTFNCSSVQTTGVMDNDYENYIINRMAIFVNIKNLHNRSNYELELYNLFDNFTFERSRLIDILPPVKIFSEKEYFDILLKYDLDTILIVNITDFGYTNQLEIQNTLINPETISESTFSIKKFYGVEQNSFNKPYITISSELIDIKNNKSFWKSTTDGLGNGYTNLYWISEKSFEDIIKTIQDYKFIKPKSK